MLDTQPRLLSVGTANPPERFTQEDIAARFEIPDPRIRSLFRSTHIHTRHLYLPPIDEKGTPVDTQGELLAKHLRGALEIGPQAVERCLAPLGLSVTDMDYLCCITSTGFMAPGLTAHVMKHMGFRADCSRADIVGMGCNAGLNGLNPVSAWARANPGKNALMLCIEVCSAAYVFDGTMRTAIVNSLFGDGSAAVLVRADPADDKRFAPRVLGFNSQIITDALGAMRFDWDDDHGKFSFFLDRDIPYVVGAHAELPVDRLLLGGSRAVGQWGGLKGRHPGRQGAQRFGAEHEPLLDVFCPREVHLQLADEVLDFAQDAIPVHQQHCANVVVEAFLVAACQEYPLQHILS